MIGYHIHGEGPAKVIVLSGWIGDWSIFTPILDAIDPTRMTLAFMDYRGYGASRGICGPCDMATIAKDARALADQMGWERFSVLGHSMGGKAALRLAADIPDRVERILAVTPVWAGAAPLSDELRAVCRNSAADLALRELLVRVTTGEGLPAHWSRRIAAESVKNCNEAAYAAYFEAWSEEDFATRAKGLPHETLVVIGARDAGLNADDIKATWLAELPNAQLLELDATGHYPMQECPPRLAKIIESFISLA